MNAGAMDVKQVGNAGGRVAIGAQQEGLQAQRPARSFLGLSFLAQVQELAASAGIGPGKDRFHGNVCRITNARIVRKTNPGSKWKQSGRAPSNSIKKRLTAQISAHDKAFLKLMSLYLCACV